VVVTGSVLDELAGLGRCWHTGVESVLAIYPEEGDGVRSHPAAADCLTRTVLWFERHLPAR
jgi:dipeptidyl aminopeptidase/acylaminoacyl peptidase